MLMVFLIDILLIQLILLVFLVFQFFNKTRDTNISQKEQLHRTCSNQQIKAVKARPHRRRERHMPICVYLEELSTGNRFRATLNKTVIVGRSVSGIPLMNDLPVSTSSYVSRKHLMMFEQNGIVYAENLSTSGTIINGHWINGIVSISQGDLLRLGDVCLRVIAVGAYH